MYSKEEKNIFKKYYPVLGKGILQFLSQLPNPSRSWTVDSIDHAARNLGVKYGLFEIGEEAFLDIETTNLNADFAYMLSYSIKVLGKDEVLTGVITKQEIFSGQFDKRVVEQCITDLKKFKRIYTYYGTKFDIPFLRTRAVYHKLDFMPFGLIQHQDIYYLVRNRFKFSRNRLEGVTEFLGIDGKTKLDGNIWVRATIGDKEALEYILKHNIADVVILEKLYNRIKEYAGVTRTSM